MNRRQNLLSVRCSAALLLAAAGFLAPGAARAAGDEDAQKPVALPQDLFANPVAPAEQALPPDTVVAKVGDRKITAGEVQRELDNILNAVGGRVPPEKMAAFRQQMGQRVLENLVNRELLVTAANQEKIEVTPEEVAKARKKLEDQIPPGTKLEELLAGEGMTVKELDANIERDLRIGKLIEKQTAGVPAPTEKDIAKFYEDNKARFQVPETAHARHILITTKKTDTEEQRTAEKARAEEVRQKLLKGGDFAELAAEYSEGPTKTRGGDLGTFPRGKMVKPFEDAVFTQEVGKIGEIVETPFGFHVIEVLERNPAKTLSLEELHDRIASSLENQGKQTALQNYLAALREKSKVEITAPEAK